jgi:hypothetical protein
MLNSVVKGRKIDDDSSMLLKFNNGATGILLATQVAAGEENNLNIRIYGEKGGIGWKQEEPNTLLFKWLDRPKEVVRGGWFEYLSEPAKLNTRVPWVTPKDTSKLLQTSIWPSVAPFVISSQARRLTRRSTTSRMSKMAFAVWPLSKQ